MSILSGFKKYKNYKTDANGDHQLQSFWTSSDTVELKDQYGRFNGKTATDLMNQTFTKGDNAIYGAHNLFGIKPFTTTTNHGITFSYNNGKVILNGKLSGGDSASITIPFETGGIINGVEYKIRLYTDTQAQNNSSITIGWSDGTSNTFYSPTLGVTDTIQDSSFISVTVNFTGTSTITDGEIGLVVTYSEDYLEDSTTSIPVYTPIGKTNIKLTEEVNTVRDSIDTKIATAVNALDASEVGGANKFISKISEVNGVISATAGNIDTTVTSGSSNPATSDAVVTYVSAQIGAVLNTNF